MTCLEVRPEVLLTRPGLLAGRNDLVSGESEAVCASVSELDGPTIAEYVNRLFYIG